LVKDIVDQQQAFWLLIYIDVLEFPNRHFRLMFEGLSAKSSGRFTSEFNTAKSNSLVREGINPAVVYTAVYMHFLTIFQSRDCSAKIHISD
jgi:hypothetical protein